MTALEVAPGGMVHVHALIYGEYVPQAILSEEWGRALGLDVLPVVHIRSVNRRDVAGGIREALKYATKGEGSGRDQARRAAAVEYALADTKRISILGALRTIKGRSEEAESEDVQAADLHDQAEAACESCGSLGEWRWTARASAALVARNGGWGLVRGPTEKNEALRSRLSGDLGSALTRSTWDSGIYTPPPTQRLGTTNTTGSTHAMVASNGMELPKVFDGAGFADDDQRVLVLRLVVQGEALGAVAIARQADRDFSEEDVSRAVHLADQAAVALNDLKLRRELEEMSWEALHALANAIDARSAWTAGHSERVTDLALEVGRALELSDKELDILHRGGLLHDLGKIGVSLRVLDHPGKLDEEMRAC